MRNMQRIVLWLVAIGFLATLIHAQSNYRYSYVPKQAYATQRFPVTLQDTNASPDRNPRFTFDRQSSVQPLSKRPLISTGNNGKSVFYTFYFKAEETDLKIPKLTIANQGKEFTLESRYVPVQTLSDANQTTFCGLIAADCKIKTSQVSTFDDKNNLVLLMIEAHEANPEEIRIPGSIEGGIEKSEQHYSKITFEYYFVIPATQKSITLSYYNTIQRKFISKTISTDFQSNPVAAQVNLNPRDSSFDKIKRYGLAGLSMFFLVMFLVKRDFFFLPLLALSTIAFLTLFTPHKTICISEGAPLYILPTSSSSTGGKIERRLKTAVLNSYNNYHKIEYQRGIIGWIKDEDLCKD